MFLVIQHVAWTAELLARKSATSALMDPLSRKMGSAHHVIRRRPMRAHVSNASSQTRPKQQLSAQAAKQDSDSRMENVSDVAKGQAVLNVIKANAYSAKPAID